jgi:hypothetical protein
VDQKVLHPAQAEHESSLSRFGEWASAALDNFASVFLCVSFSSITTLFGLWWHRLLAGD